MGETMIRRDGYRSLFWPIVLIGVGVIWLLANMNIISAANLVVLFRLWPILLIVIGLDLLIGRQSPFLGGLIGIGAVILMVVLMLIGPSIGLGAPNIEINQAAYSEPREDAQSANVVLNMAVGTMEVNPLSDSPSLFEADISYVGSVEFQQEGESSKFISLSQEDENVNFGLDFFAGLILNPQDDLLWNIRLSPDVPLDLDVTSGTGALDLNLTELQLTRLNVNTGTGGVDLDLPSMDESYDVSVSSGTGGGAITLEEGAAISLRLNAGTGGFSVDVPDAAAVRVEGSTGTGIDIPSRFTRLTAEDDNFVGESGTWETEGFASADRKITIHFEGGTGGLTIR